MKILITESQYLKILKEQGEYDDTPLEDEPELDNAESDEDDLEDFGFDYEDDIDYEDDFQNRMRNRERIRSQRPSSIGIGDNKRWDKESEKPFSPIKPDDLPLEKFLQSKYSKSKK